jgi:prevent-host-death family protein
MGKREPVTLTIEAADVSRQQSELQDLLSRGDARVIVARSGVPVAVITSAEDLDWCPSRCSPS